MLLLKVQAGSKLYGYATDTSDDDYYEVHTEPFTIETRDLPRKSKQTIIDGIDTLQVTLSEFMVRANAGSHQALDAMFTHTTLVDKITGLREGYHAGYEIIPAYQRIITKFATQSGYRKQRHALRALYNLTDMLETGRYNPSLSDKRIETILTEARKPYPEFKKTLLNLTPVQLDHLLP